MLADERAIRNVIRAGFGAFVALHHPFQCNARGFPYNLARIFCQDLTKPAEI